MNRDQVEGSVKNVIGKAQQQIGELTGDKGQQVKGVLKQVEGNVQKGIGNIEQAADKPDAKAP